MKCRCGNAFCYNCGARIDWDHNCSCSRNAETQRLSKQELDNFIILEKVFTEICSCRPFGELDNCSCSRNAETQLCMLSCYSSQQHLKRKRKTKKRRKTQILHRSPTVARVCGAETRIDDRIWV